MPLEALRVCLASQSPPVRFHTEDLDHHGLGEVVDLRQLREGADWSPAAGGVPVMLRHMIPRLVERGLWRDPAWVALNPAGPERALLDGIRLHSVGLDPAAAGLYARAKEKLWNAVHDLGREGASPSEFQAFAEFNWRTANAMIRVLPEMDVAYVHDFQLLQVGALLGPVAPAVFRWHIPFRPGNLGPTLRRYVVRCMEGYDAVVVSTRRDLEGLLAAGYRGLAHQVYPYVRPPPPAPARADRQAFGDRWGLPADAPVALVVARMDPIKGQDRALRALPAVRRRVPGARLLLVGNGSFSSSGKGLGLPKARRWREGLEALTASLGLRDAVTFTGYLPPAELEAAWDRADAVLVPSTQEGFGTTAVEAWMRSRPVILSQGAGASELVVDGVNGLTHGPDDVEGLAGHLARVLEDRDLAGRLGERGRELAQVCALDRGAEAEDRVLRESIQRFHERSPP